MGQPSSLRPLSMLNTAEKHFERLLPTRLVPHLKGLPQLLSNRQFGFRVDRSTEGAIGAVLYVARVAARFAVQQ